MLAIISKNALSKFETTNSSKHICLYFIKTFEILMVCLLLRVVLTFISLDCFDLFKRCYYYSEKHKDVLDLDL